MHLCYDGNLLITLLQICCWITQLKDFSKIGQQIFGVIMTTDVVVWRKKTREKSLCYIWGIFWFTCAKQEVKVEVQKSKFHGVRNVIFIDDQLGTGSKLAAACVHWRLTVEWWNVACIRNVNLLHNLFESCLSKAVGVTLITAVGLSFIPASSQCKFCHLLIIFYVCISLLYGVALSQALLLLGWVTEYWLVA